MSLPLLGSGPSNAQSGISPPEPPVNTVAPVVSGTETEGETLSTTDGTWTGTEPITFEYQWQRNTGSWGDIGSATNSTYVLQAGDVGYTVRPGVRATGPGGVSDWVYGDPTGTIQAAAPPDPSTVTGLSLWLEDLYTSSLFQDAALSTPASNGDPVGGWVDQSGAGRNATQSTAGSRPTLRSGTGIDGLQFDDTDDTLGLTSVNLGTTAFTVYVVFYWPNATYQGTFLWDAAWTDELGVRYNAGNMRIRVLDNDNVGSTTTSVGAVLAGYCVARYARTTATNVEVEVAGKDAVNITVNNLPTDFTISKIQKAGSSCSGGRIRAVYAWFGKNLDAGERATVEAWIDYRYGVTP